MRVLGVYMNTIPFIVDIPKENAENDEKRIFGSLKTEDKIGLREIPVGVLKENLANISEGLLSVLEDVKKVGKFKLKEVTLQVEVSADGGIQLIGTAKIGGKGAITLTFAE
jgi:hypothetical protein